MSYGSGLTLQPRQKLHPLSSVNLLIVSDDDISIAPIIEALAAAGLDFAYEVFTSSEFTDDLSLGAYDAVLYNYCVSQACLDPLALLNQQEWWQKIVDRVPLILITDILGDEIAVECIQAGISGYVLRHKLHKLPKILERCLISFVKQHQSAREKNLIRQQQEYIQQLEQAKQRWETQEAKKQELLSHLHHELRNPITAIIGFGGMLKEEIYGSLNQRQMQYVCAIATSGEHLLELVNDYLDLAKIDAHQETLYPEKLAVEDICRASLAMVQEKARNRGLKLVFSIDKSVDFCKADKLRLKQILVNLLSNAVKFTETGSVTLQVKTKGEMLTFAVIDTGIGISPSDQQKLFQPFQQIRTPIHRRDRGTGLGLALSRKLARLHGGDITLTSNPGKGSCFTLHIPRGS